MEVKKEDSLEEKVIRELYAGESIYSENSLLYKNQNNEGNSTNASLLRELTEPELKEPIRPVVCICNENIPTLAVSRLKDRFNVITLNAEDNRETMLTKLRGAAGLFMYGDTLRLDARLLRAIGNSLKVVGLMSDNFDNVDVRELSWRKIKIGSARCEVVDSVAETAIGLALTVAHRFKPSYTSIDESMLPRGIYNKMMKGGRCGIIGSGDVGTAIARKLMSFGVSDIFYSVHRRSKSENYGALCFVDFDFLLRASDFIFVVCPITEKTKNLFDYTAFYRMKRSCVFISVSSWGIFKMKDLIRALREKLIWGAGLDMPESVQLDPQHPLLNLDNCFVTPHLGNCTQRTRDRMAMVTADNIIGGIKGTKMPCQVCFKVEPAPPHIDKPSLAQNRLYKTYPSYAVIL